MRDLLDRAVALVLGLCESRSPRNHRPRPGRRAPNQQRRTASLGFAFVLMAFALVARLALVQLSSAQAYLDQAETQAVRTEVLPAYRGTMTDRNGVPLALSVPATLVWADPELVADPESEAAALAEPLGISVEELTESLSSDSRYVRLARHVDPELADELRELGLPGIFFSDEPDRQNPMGETAARLVGEVDVDGNGRSGLELLYDDVLAGVPGERVVERSVSGDSTIPGGEIGLEQPEPGSELTLTLDVVLQYGVEQILLDAVENTESLGGVALVATPDSQLLAAANVDRDDEGNVRVAPELMAATRSYELGSVIKPVTAAAVLEEGLLGPADTVRVSDQIVLNEGTQWETEFWDHDPHATEDMTVTDVLTQSSNVGTYRLAQLLGEERLHSYMSDFGFGRTTGLGFPGESAGILRPLEDWYPVDLMTQSIGTTVGVTPLQLLGLYNTIANDGVYVPPHIVSAVDGEPVQLDGVREVVSPTTADLVTAALQNVVEVGTGQNAAIDGYQVAGKTGTAPKRGEGGYDDGWMTSFVGFLPADDPAFTIVVILDDPPNRSGDEATGGRKAGPVFFDIAELALRHLGVLSRYGSVGDGTELAPSGDGRVRALTALEVAAQQDEDEGSDGAPSDDDADDADSDSDAGADGESEDTAVDDDVGSGADPEDDAGSDAGAEDEDDEGG